MNIKDITFCIKTFERPVALQRCIDSIRKYYPDAYIIVADDSAKPQRPDGCDEYFELPYDIGLSSGRNYLVDQVKTKYMVLLDDDCDFYSRTNIKLMYDTIENTDFNLVGGFMGKNLWHGCFHEERGNLYALLLGTWRDEVNGVKQYDFVENFFIAETDVIKKVRWADEIKIESEHEEFFYRGRNVLKCGFVNSYTGNSHVVNDEKYKRFRYKRSYQSMTIKYYMGNTERHISTNIKKYDGKPNISIKNAPRVTDFNIGNRTKFIITGCARSGTHLLQSALNEHSEITVADELTEWLYTPEQIQDKLNNSDGFICHYTEQNHNTIKYKMLNKDIKYILLKRDPLYSFVSLKRANLLNSWHNPPLIDTDIVDDDITLKLYPLEYRFYKKRYNEYYDEVKKILGDRCIEIKYEDMINDFDTEMKKIQNFIGIQVEKLEIKTNKQINKPYDKLILNWQEMLDTDKLPPIERPLLSK